MRLIDADVLKQHIDKLPALPDGNFAGNHSALKALINMQPTIESSTNCSEIQNSSDCISRQAAIDAIRAMQNRLFAGDDLILVDKAWVMTELMMLPPVQPEQKWIPCSERLPEKDGRYQVTRYDYVANTEFIDILWYEENLWWNRHSTGDYAVTAWMPLPEPYKAESEEQE